MDDPDARAGAEGGADEDVERLDVGGYERHLRSLNEPRAAFSGGRRHSDRWVAYLLVVLIALGGVSTVYSVQRQHETEQQLQIAAQDRADLLEEVREQNRAILCLGNNTTSAELAFAEYLIKIREASADPEVLQAVAELIEARDRLAAAQAAGIEPCIPPVTR